jgi:CRP-like cAMP-binding protein
VVRRFESGRDFYVILAGRAEVQVGDRVVRELGPGDFFGELAALDWGADYGYLRMAKLTAATLRALMHDVPEIDAHVWRAANERLAIS